MRTLTYKVTGQRLIPVGDHTGLIAGTEGYLQAKFEFDDDWKDCKKVASFYINNDEDALPLNEDDTCMIPSKALSESIFELRVEGRKTDYRILTNRIREKQSGGVI
jgi:hypothetical protein